MNQSKDRDNNTTKRKKIDEKQAIIDKNASLQKCKKIIVDSALKPIDLKTNLIQI